MNKQTVLKILAETSRILLGMTFIFSGFVKSVDPYGFAMKIEEYLAAFHLECFSFLSMTASFSLCGFEFVLGVLLFLGIYPKWTSRLVLLLMGFMTALTFYLAVANPVSDCGCFGDAVILTNWETFFKNIFLLAFAIFLVLCYRYVTPVFHQQYKLFALTYTVLFTFGLLLVSYRYDNVADFRPYHAGANLMKKMIVPENERPVEEIFFIYEKDGKQREFTAGNYPWQDSSWIFVERITKVIKPGKLPEITDFHINHYVFSEDVCDIIDEMDITEEVLHTPGYSFLVITPFLTDIREEEKLKLNDVAQYAAEYGYPFYCLTASLYQDIVTAKTDFLPQADFCGTDEKVLKTVVRNNPGLVILKEGIVIRKWSKHLIPSKGEWNQPLEQSVFGQIVQASRTNTRNTFFCFFILLLPLAVIKIIEKIQNNNHLKKQQ